MAPLRRATSVTDRPWLNTSRVAHRLPVDLEITVVGWAWYRLDVGVLGICGLDASPGATTNSLDKVATQRAFIASAAEVVVAADADKLASSASFVIAATRELDRVVTTSGVPPIARRAASARHRGGRCSRQAPNHPDLTERYGGTVRSKRVCPLSSLEGWGLSRGVDSDPVCWTRGYGRFGWPWSWRHLSAYLACAAARLGNQIVPRIQAISTFSRAHAVSIAALS